MSGGEGARGLGLQELAPNKWVASQGGGRELSLVWGRPPIRQRLRFSFPKESTLVPVIHVCAFLVLHHSQASLLVRHLSVRRPPSPSAAMMNTCRLFAALSLLTVASAFLAPPPSSRPLIPHHQTRAVRSGDDEGGDFIPTSGYFVSRAVNEPATQREGPRCAAILCLYLVSAGAVWCGGFFVARRTLWVSLPMVIPR